MITTPQTHSGGRMVVSGSGQRSRVPGWTRRIILAILLLLPIVQICYFAARPTSELVQDSGAALGKARLWLQKGSSMQRVVAQKMTPINCTVDTAALARHPNELKEWDMANKQTTGQLLDALDKIALRVASIQSIMAADPGASTHKHAVDEEVRAARRLLDQITVQLANLTAAQDRVEHVRRLCLRAPANNTDANSTQSTIACLSQNASCQEPVPVVGSGAEVRSAIAASRRPPLMHHAHNWFQANRHAPGPPGASTKHVAGSSPSLPDAPGSLRAVLNSGSQSRQQVPTCPVTHPHAWDPTQLSLTPQEEVCEKHLGLSVVNQYLDKTQDWCGSSSSSSSDRTNSWMRCSHHTFPWNKQGLICEAHNVTIDFSKISKHDKDMLPKSGDPHFKFAQDSTAMRCGKTQHYTEQRLMPLMARQLKSTRMDPNFHPPPNHVRIEETTYLMPRDNDGDNIFHMSADFVNMEVAYRVLDLDVNTVQIVVMDKMQLYSYTDMLARTYSGGRAVLQRKSFQASAIQTFVFQHLVWHLESPASNVHERVTLKFPAKEPMRCRSSTMWRAYVRRVLCSYDLWTHAPPSVPHITLSIRTRTSTKNVGRILSNQNELEDVFREGNMLTWQTVNLAHMSFAEQIAVMRKTSIYVGIHGAGLMLIMFTADESVLLEIHPNYRRDRHFRNAARLSGRTYMPLRTTETPTCKGSSDNIKVDKTEFRSILSEAVRLARSFDDGLSECGLVCPDWILSHDDRLKDDYNRTKTLHKDVEAPKFPCND